MQNGYIFITHEAGFEAGAFLSKSIDIFLAS